MKEDIIECKQDEKALWESEEKYRTILEDTLDIIYSADSNGIVSYINPQVSAFGYSPAEIIGHNIVEFIHPDDLDHVFNDFKKTMRTGEEFPTAFRIVKKDGSFIYVEEIGKAVKEGDKVVGLTGVIRDISDRKQTEEALQESEERYRSLVENINLGIVLMDADHNITMANTALGKILKRDVSEFIGKKCFKEFEKREAVCLNCSGIRAMETRLPQEVKVEAILNDRTKVPVWIRDFPILGPDGKATGFIEVVEDITERKQAEKALKDTETFLDNIIHSASDAIITVDLEDKITSFSPSAETMFGYKAEDIVGNSVLKLYPKRQRKKRKKWKERLLKEGRLDRVRTKQLKADGKTFGVSLSMALLKDAKGNPIGIVGISHDITRELKSEQELKKAYKELKDLDRMKGEFLQNVTHELRTPLTAMLTTIRLLKDVIKEKKVRNILDLNERSAWRLNRLIGDLLDAGSIERGVMELKLESVDIGELLRDALDDIQGIAADRQLKVEFNMEKGVPPVMVDKDSMYRVVLNLLHNAVKFNKDGGLLEVKASALDGTVEVSVEDTGIGIEKKDLGMVFERFYQVDGSTKRRYPGTGIGLSLAKKLVEMHGGRIWAESKPDEWTRFTFSLPVEEQL